MTAPGTGTFALPAPYCSRPVEGENSNGRKSLSNSLESAIFAVKTRVFPLKRPKTPRVSYRSGKYRLLVVHIGEMHFSLSSPRHCVDNTKEYKRICLSGFRPGFRSGRKKCIPYNHNEKVLLFQLDLLLYILTGRICIRINTNSCLPEFSPMGPA